jgi:hypothetical protein
MSRKKLRKGTNKERIRRKREERGGDIKRERSKTPKK